MRRKGLNPQPLDLRFKKHTCFDHYTDCLVWKGGKNKGGYGLFNINKKTQLAHRVAWFLGNGPIPEGMCVLHKSRDYGVTNTLIRSIKKGRLWR